VNPEHSSKAGREVPKPGPPRIPQKTRAPGSPRMPYVSQKHASSPPHDRPRSTNPNNPEEARPDLNDVSTAPYHFVRFVKPILASETDPDDFRSRLDEVPDKSYSGYLDVKIHALTPVFVGGQANENEPPVRKSLVAGNSKYPLIPGSSVLGVYRALLGHVFGDTISFDEHRRPIWDRQPFGSGSRNAHYKKARGLDNLSVENNPGSQRTGVLIKSKGGLRLTPATATRIRWDQVEERYGLSRDAYESDEHQFMARDGHYLLVTGAGAKETQCWVYEVDNPISANLSYEVDKHILDTALEGLDSTTTGSTRRADVEKHLERGVPVFFDLVDTEVVRIGFSGGFKIAGFSTYDTLPNFVRSGKNSEETALSRLFGDVAKDAEQDDQTPVTVATRSRLSFGDFVSNNGELLRPEEACSLSMLSPKVKAHHLRLKEGDYFVLDTGNPPSARGREVYLHRWPKDDIENPSVLRILQDDHRASMPDAAAKHNEKVEQAYVPVASGADFTGRIRFWNLSRTELGALVLATWLMNPIPTESTQEPPIFAHKIGGLRPLGLGSVYLTGELYLETIDPATSKTTWDCYRKLRLPVTIDDDKVKEIRDDFIEWLCKRTSKTGAGQNYVGALEDLLRSHAWKNRPDRADTAEMCVRKHARRMRFRTLEKVTELADKDISSLPWNRAPNESGGQ
jgi:hypothetical protein